MSLPSTPTSPPQPLLICLSTLLHHVLSRPRITQNCKCPCKTYCHAQRLWGRLTSSNKPSSTSHQASPDASYRSSPGQAHFVYITNELLYLLFCLRIRATSRVRKTHHYDNSHQ
ncbi:hypothetical protein CRENBAI_018042 [Crenichthys baileyi]|uniref:Secreted protein n=1 Tax=Crenichthys baileyi TaxID=28760 RepID=A0AAV9S422_9TELE